jgi:hypothetical protein
LYLCLRRLILGENQGSFEGIKETSENGERTGNKGKTTSETKENQHRGKAVTKWTNCCGVVGKWTSANLENGWIVDQPIWIQLKSGQT